MSRQAYIDHKKKLVLFYSQKCGCTSLMHWFTFAVLGQKKGFTASLPDKGPRDWLSRTGYSVPYFIAANAVSRGNYTDVVVTRHPATRVLSAFLNKFVTYNGKPRSLFKELEPFVRDQIVSFGYKKNGSDYKGMSFAQFLDHLEERINDAARNGREPKLNAHWNTQVPFYFRETGFKYGEIIRLEDFPDAFSSLNSRFGHADYRPIHANPTVYKGERVDEDLSQVNSIDLSARALNFAQHNFLTPAILDRIYQIYEIDFSFFDYDKTPAENNG